MSALSGYVQTPLTAGTDYLTPNGDGSALTGVVSTQAQSIGGGGNGGIVMIGNGQAQVQLEGGGTPYSQMYAENFFGGGANLTGVVAASGWPTTLSSYTNDAGFLTDVSGASVTYATSAGSGWPTSLSGFSNDPGFLIDVSGASVLFATASNSSLALSGLYGDSLAETGSLQWSMVGDLSVGSGGIGCEFLSSVFFGSRGSSPYYVTTAGNAYFCTLSIGNPSQLTIDNVGTITTTSSISAAQIYGDGTSITNVNAVYVSGSTGTAIFTIDGTVYYPHVTAGVLTFTDTP